MFCVDKVQGEGVNCEAGEALAAPLTVALSDVMWEYNSLVAAISFTIVA